MVGFERAETRFGVETGLVIAFDDSPLRLTTSELNTTGVKFEDRSLAY